MKHLLLSILLITLGADKVSEEYNAEVISVYDGDTVTCDIDLGFDVHTIQKVRLHGIDAPEIRGEERPEGLISRDALRGLINGEDIRIVNHGRGKYGRVIGELYIDTISVSDWMVRNGYAEYRDY